MVVVLVLLTLAVCIAVDVIRQHRATAHAAAPLTTQPLPSATKVLERLYHPGHSWAMVENPHSVMVGVDDIAQRFVGEPDNIEIAEKGAIVSQGEPFVTLRKGKRSIALVAPLSGILLDVNSGLSAQPSLLKDSPYEKGWIAKIAPSNLLTELRNLLRGALAERWRESVQAQVASWFAPKLGTVLQDGGQWIDNLSNLLNEEEWKELTQTLFLVQPTEQSKTKSS